MRKLLRDSFHLLIKLAWLLMLPVIRARIRLSGNPPRITCDRNDGGGAQLHGRISTIAFAEALGLKYIHTPLSDVHFMETDEEVERWNKLIKFTRFWPGVIDDAKIIEFKSLISLLAKVVVGTLRDQDLLQVEHCHSFTDRFPKYIDALRPRLLAAFQANDLVMDEKLTLGGDVVIHFRGLVGPEDASSPRLSSNSILGKKIAIARNQRKTEKSLVICVNPTPELMQGLDETFILDADSDVHTAFTYLARAKVAILARSSLSYVAALVNPNTVYYEDFWHPKMPGWKLVN